MDIQATSIIVRAPEVPCSYFALSKALGGIAQLRLLYLPAGMLREVIDLQLSLKVRLISIRVIGARLCPHAGHLGLQHRLRKGCDWHARLHTRHPSLYSGCTNVPHSMDIRKRAIITMQKGIPWPQETICDKYD